MVLGGRRNNSATKAGISESQSVTIPEFFYNTRGEDLRRDSYDANKGLLVGTTLSPGQREAFIGRCEGVKEDVLSYGI
jgi:hypothetical protein